MTHPQLEQALQKVDNILAAYPNLCQYDRLRDLEKQTGQPKAYFFFAFVTLLSSAVYGFGGMKLVSDIIGFGYPAYMSFKAIDSADPIDDTQWLTYWVVFALFSVVESAMSLLISWIPFYFVTKISFFLWLYHPKSMGAALLYKRVIKPLLVPYLQAFERTKPQKRKA